MTIESVEKVANAVLYEGYMLYPYRPSAVKNQQRFNFGVIYPRWYCEHQAATDSWFMHTEFLVQGPREAELSIKVRFLQMLVRPRDPNLGSSQSNPDAGPQSGTIDSVSSTWQETIERNVSIPAGSVGNLCTRPLVTCFSFPVSGELDHAEGRSGAEDWSARNGHLIEASVHVVAQFCGGSVWKVKARLENETTWKKANETNRERILSQALLSAHKVLRVAGGEFVSLLDPPEPLRMIAADCRNVGTWPVLAGEEGARNTMLSSPIILYDYPRLAPESPQDLFDSTEIDELLSLCVLTLTDEEKEELRRSDERARHILEQVESLSSEQFMEMHGILRQLRPLKEKEQ